MTALEFLHSDEEPATYQTDTMAVQPLRDILNNVTWLVEHAE